MGAEDESESEEIADKSDDETESEASGWCYSPDPDNENAEKCLSIQFNMAKCKSQRTLGCAWMEAEDEEEDETVDDDEAVDAAGDVNDNDEEDAASEQEENNEDVAEEEEAEITEWCESNSGLSTMKEYCKIPQTQEDCEAMSACYWVIASEANEEAEEVADQSASGAAQKASSGANTAAANGQSGCCMISESETLTSWESKCSVLSSETDCLLPMNSVASRCKWIDGEDADCTIPEPIGCCMAILKSGVSVCGSHQVREACDERTSCYWLTGETDCSWVDDDAFDRDLTEKLSQLLSEGDEPEEAPLEALEEENEEEEEAISEEEGCCAGNSESTSKLCAMVSIQDDCEMMGPCGWVSGADADCELGGDNEENEVDSVNQYLFGGGSSITNVMETQLNMTTLLSVIFAATAMHCIYQCWSKRRHSKKGTLNGRRESEFDDLDEDEEEDDEGEGIPDDESMYFQYV